MSSRLEYERQPDKIRHRMVDLVRQRVFAIALGYEDLNRPARRTTGYTTARYAHLARDSIQTAAARITGSIGGNLSSVQVVDETNR